MQMQTVEQERMVEFYFRILSWLSDVIPRAAEPVKACPQPAPMPQNTRAPRRRVRPGRIELCALRTGQSFAAGRLSARHLN